MSGKPSLGCGTGAAGNVASGGQARRRTRRARGRSRRQFTNEHGHEGPVVAHGGQGRRVRFVHLHAQDQAAPLAQEGGDLGLDGGEKGLAVVRMPEADDGGG